MIERIDGSMQRRASADNGERHPGSRDARAGARGGEPGGQPAQAGQPAQTLDAQLAELISDVERLCAAQDEADTLPPADPHALAGRIVQDGAAAIAAQAGLGPQGVRLVLGVAPTGPAQPPR